MAAVPGVRRSELGDALRTCRSAFIGVGVMSCMINLLYLTGSSFMIEVYYRELPPTSGRNAELLVAIGMSGRLTRRWSEANEKYLAGNQRASDVSGGLGAIAKVMRMTLQSAVLAVGAYLVIHQEATAGIIIAE